MPNLRLRQVRQDSKQAYFLLPPFVFSSFLPSFLLRPLPPQLASTKRPNQPWCQYECCLLQDTSSLAIFFPVHTFSSRQAAGERWRKGAAPGPRRRRRTPRRRSRGCSGKHPWPRKSSSKTKARNTGPSASFSTSTRADTNHYTECWVLRILWFESV
jgi:hypothetical protein